MNKIMMILSSAKVGGPYVSHKRIMESYLSNKYYFVPFYKPRIRQIMTRKFFRDFKLTIKEEKPDCIQIPGLQIDAFFLLLYIRIIDKTIPTVLVVHGSVTESMRKDFLTRVVGVAMEKWSLKRATITYGVSDYVGNLSIVKRHCSNYAGTIYNLPFCNTNGLVDVDALRRKLGISPDSFVVVSTGRITQEKGYDNLLQVMDNLKLHEDIRFLIVGDGPYLPIIKKKKLENVICTGQVDDVSQFLAISNLFVILTKHETLCNSIIEAGMFKLPCIATRVGGIPEIITEGCGSLVEVNSITETEKEILRYKDSTYLCEEMGENLQKRIDTVFSERRNMEKLDNIYNKVLGDQL
ncbi:MAG: glycosyltransferase family 4 protein [Prolixibacteraceae bacterium]|nr:glycosyltransferase family 4 protein [Prolixibacteraceae bacterium]